ncbi:DUF6134 family protein [Paracoccus lutimaris]|jgi:hypothetical protein|uniref:Uncharacterized protein n=1 Tax=Paracoccus lutimaris TaxID=1490030 RepID=A0A368YGI7_9RHOB|nr:DUF6134 family protein [Paracoccus lutimaris]RCW78759.1 hypothetical protein DFP89_13210 [Paracoccus lutimaris]
MKNKLGITAALTGLLLASAAISAPMGSIPDSGYLTFDVIRKGKDIGDYSLRFSPKGDGVTVSVRTNIAVKVPVIGVSAYRFEQTSTESWNGSKLQALSSRTNDNGKAHDIHVGPSPLIPASLWNAEIVKQRKVLNTIDSSTDTVSVRNLGGDSIATGHGKVSATHYAISGGLNRELWFDSKGQLVHVRFAADDGSTVDYVLR